MGSFDVPFSFLIILNTFEIGVLLFIFEAYFLKEIFFASLIVLRAFALAILKFVWLRYEGFVNNFCRALFFFFMISLQSSLNQGLFFLGLGEVLGMFSQLWIKGFLCILLFSFLLKCLDVLCIGF